jgi:hypothetical protein
MGGVDDAVHLEYKAAEEVEPMLAQHMNPKDPKGPWLPNKAQKTKSSFEANEAYPLQDPKDYKWVTFEDTNVVNKVDDLYSDTSALKQFATGKDLTKQELAIAKQKRKQVKKINDDPAEELAGKEYVPDYEDFASGGRVPFSKGKKVVEGLTWLANKISPGSTKVGKTSKPMAEKTGLKKALADFQEREKAAESKITSHAGDLEKAGEGRFTKAEVLLQMFENTIKQDKSANTKKRFTNFSKEIQGNPELANDPQVWGFFTKGLPKNQRLVVYGDDTVDFWRQSEFGPHNIKTTEKFMQKHPHLTRDQAVKIQNMEPEDQIFEMKKIEALRKKGMHASGGLAGMLGE